MWNDTNKNIFLIGECLNTFGNKLFKQALIVNDVDTIRSITLKQISNNADALDVCVALNDAPFHEAQRMLSLIEELLSLTGVPLVIDTGSSETIEMVITRMPIGRCIINSVSPSDGNNKISNILRLALKYKAHIIILTINLYGMAKTAEQKYKSALSIYRLALELGFPVDRLIFDPLAFPLFLGQTGPENLFLETLNGLKLIKTQLPDVKTLLGISNFSFGLSGYARIIINSVVLHHAIQYGLDMAIANPDQLMGYDSIGTDTKDMIENFLFIEDASRQSLQQQTGILSYIKSLKKQTRVNNKFTIE